MSLSSALLRPVRLVRDLFTDRDHPDLGRLAAIEDPWRFVWAILPHAARTFSASISLLPRTLAEGSAIAYLYCRMLDTYEDLIASPEEREDALAAFAERLATGTTAPAIVTDLAKDPRDEAHLLLVARCALVDEAYATLPAEVQQLIRTLVKQMADGMRWASSTFATQGGVLESDAQLTRYCNHVLGEPVLFSARLLCWYQTGDPSLPPASEADALDVGALIQLANVTRDIEKDLARGIAYRPELRADLHALRPEDVEQVERIRLARGALMDTALAHAPAYRRLVDQVCRKGFSMARASAVLMLLFTDRYYSGCATRVGRPPWVRRRSRLRLLFTALPAALSSRWAQRIFMRVEEDFQAACVEPRSSCSADPGRSSS